MMSACPESDTEVPPAGNAEVVVADHHAHVRAEVEVDRPPPLETTITWSCSALLVEQ
jgi:hypothetical protein